MYGEDHTELHVEDVYLSANDLSILEFRPLSPGSVIFVVYFGTTGNHSDCTVV